MAEPGAPESIDSQPVVGLPPKVDLPLTELLPDEFKSLQENPSHFFERGLKVEGDLEDGRTFKATEEVFTQGDNGKLIKYTLKVDSQGQENDSLYQEATLVKNVDSAEKVVLRFRTQRLDESDTFEGKQGWAMMVVGADDREYEWRQDFPPAGPEDISVNEFFVDGVQGNKFKKQVVLEIAASVNDTKKGPLAEKLYKVYDSGKANGNYRSGEIEVHADISLGKPDRFTVVNGTNGKELAGWLQDKRSKARQN